MRFSKLRAAGRSYLVVNAIDSAGGEWKQWALALCAESSGLIGDQFAVISHRNRGEFDLFCFEPDGSQGEPSAALAACAAVSIRRRYGYRRALLRDTVFYYEVAVAGASALVLPRPHSAIAAAPAEAVELDVSHLFDGDFLGSPL